MVMYSMSCLHQELEMAQGSLQTHVTQMSSRMDTVESTLQQMESTLGDIGQKLNSIEASVVDNFQIVIDTLGGILKSRQPKSDEMPVPPVERPSRHIAVTANEEGKHG